MNARRKTAHGTDMLDGKTALVTGAGRGIGRAIAEHLADLGTQVILVARSAQQLAEVGHAIVSNGGRAEPVTVDLARPAATEEFIESVLERMTIDILINNAASIGPLGSTTSSRADQLIETFNVNTVAPILMSAGFAPSMIRTGWGRIVNLSSGVVSHPDSMVGATAYAASKAALEGHTINFAAELAGTGVTVNAFRPGIVDTTMQQWIREQNPDVVGRILHEQFVGWFGRGRLSPPDRPAAALITRLRSESTGRIWDVDNPDA